MRKFWLNINPACVLIVMQKYTYLYFWGKYKNSNLNPSIAIYILDLNLAIFCVQMSSHLAVLGHQQAP